jgi:hypothetical protein
MHLMIAGNSVGSGPGWDAITVRTM